MKTIKLIPNLKQSFRFEPTWIPYSNKFGDYDDELTFEQAVQLVERRCPTIHAPWELKVFSATHPNGYTDGWFTESEKDEWEPLPGDPLVYRWIDHS